MTFADDFKRINSRARLTALAVIGRHNVTFEYAEIRRCISPHAVGSPANGLAVVHGLQFQKGEERRHEWRTYDLARVEELEVLSDNCFRTRSDYRPLTFLITVASI